MTGYTTQRVENKVSRRDRGMRRAMLRRTDEVNVFAGFEIGFVVVTKKEARKLLRKKGSLVTVREVEELGMMFIEPVPF